MLRDLQEISDGKIYGCNDMVRAACGDCAGCHACCEKMGTSIVLDPCDIWRLTTVTGKNFEQLLADTIELQVVDGVILPNLRMDGEKEQCVFLNEQGRCRIHAMRPGLCRVFPLGRIYEEGRIRYFLQMDACQKPGRSKVKVGKWLDTPQMEIHERFLLDWHAIRKQLEKQMKDGIGEQEAKTINMFLLNLFFIKPYEPEQDFYEQYEERRAMAGQAGLK